MSYRTITTSLAPEVYIGEVLGSLEIKGWERTEIAIKAEPSELDLEDADDVFRLSCRSDCVLRLPHGATVRVGSVHGEARFKLLEDQLSIEEVMGSLILRNVSETRVDNVHGELLAKHIAGDLRAQRVLGNASVRDVQGDCGLTEVMGNLDLRDIEGEIQAQARGNARVRLRQMDGEAYRIQASGNLNCRIPEDANATLELSSGARSIRLKLPGRTGTIQQSEFTLTLGGGETRMALAAAGELVVSSMEPGLDDEDEGEPGARFGEMTDDFSQRIAEQVEAQMEAQMEAMTRQLNEQLSHLSDTFGRSGLSPEQTEDIMRRTRESNERAAARAQERIRRAQERLERKMEANRRRSEAKAQAAHRRSQARGRQGWNVDWQGPQGPEPPKEPVSDEERMMILRMLEQKKISLEQAEQLLAALEGKST